MSTANEYIKAGERSYEPTVGDIITDYRHYVHEQAVTTPSLRALGDFLIKKGPKYTTSPVRIVRNLNGKDEKSAGVLDFDDPLELYKQFSSQTSEEGILRVIFMEGTSQSSIAVVGSSIAMDPVNFCPHIDEARTTSKEGTVSFPVCFDSQLYLGLLTVLILRDKKSTTGNPGYETQWINMANGMKYSS